MKFHLYLFTSVSFLFVFMADAGAQEFRQMRPIAAPGVQEKAPAPEGAKEVPRIRLLDRKAVEKAMQMLVDSWNTQGMANHLLETFYDKSRLMDVLEGKIPRDARLRLLAVRSFRILNQYLKPASDGDLLISSVSVTARTQVEWNHPVQGFQRYPGEQVYILRITQKVIP